MTTAHTPHRIRTMTFDQKVTVLLSYGFAVGKRDPRLNTRYPGAFMVCEVSDEEELTSQYDLPTTDGSNGLWCVVGDDLAHLVDEAMDIASSFSHFDAVVADVLAGGDGILHIDGTGAGPSTRSPTL